MSYCSHCAELEAQLAAANERADRYRSERDRAVEALNAAVAKIDYALARIGEPKEATCQTT